jgi:hypothetical protein
MWFFKHVKQTDKTPVSGPACTLCGSTKTKLVVNHGTDRPDYVRIWKGQRVLTYRCLNCGGDFYADEPPGGIPDAMLDSDSLIDDEEALRAAEAELKRQTEQGDDRTCR